MYCVVVCNTEVEFIWALHGGVTTVVRELKLYVIHSSLIVFVIKRDVANQITSMVGVLCFSGYVAAVTDLVASTKDISMRYLG